MKYKRYCLHIFSVLSFITLTTVSLFSSPLYTGFRGSRISGFTADRLIHTADSMASLHNQPGQAAAVWIVSYYGENGDIYVQFPNASPLPHCHFNTVDHNESYLDAFDNAGIKVWLQIEPGAANVNDLIDIVLTRYGHHTCINGFGVDVEWLDTHLHSGGRRVNDNEALSWENLVQSYDSTYTLFLKHYSSNRMPETYRGNIIFVDDSQGHGSYSQFIANMSNWGNTFSPNPVGYQYGYEWDRNWWDNYINPPAKLGNGLLNAIDNTYMLLWVDFTLGDVFPETTLISRNISTDKQIDLLQATPNPFNPSTVFTFSLTADSKVRLLVFDSSGRLVKTLYEHSLSTGQYHISWQPHDLPSGNYIAILQGDSFSQSLKISYLK